MEIFGTRKRIVDHSKRSRSVCWCTHALRFLLIGEIRDAKGEPLVWTRTDLEAASCTAECSQRCTEHTAQRNELERDLAVREKKCGENFTQAAKSEGKARVNENEKNVSMHLNISKRESASAVHGTPVAERSNVQRTRL